MCGKLIRAALIALGAVVLSNAALADEPQLRTVNFGQGTYTMVWQTAQAQPRPYTLTGQSDRQANVRVIEVGQGRIIVQTQR